MARFVCDRCQTTWDEGEARCPKCLRKTSVRSLDRATSEAARLASGDQSQTEGARRATALLIAVAANIALAISISWVWETLTALSLRWPALFAGVVAGGAWIAAALWRMTGWAVFAQRIAIAIGLGLWAFASGTIAVASASDLSPPFTVGLALVSFAAGVISVLWWLRSREEPAGTRAGKWR